MVANNFKNVYVFKAIDGSFRLDKRIEISDTTGIKNPDFNQRSPYIQLVYGDKKVNLTEDGVVKDGEGK